MEEEILKEIFNLEQEPTDNDVWILIIIVILLMQPKDNVINININLGGE